MFKKRRQIPSQVSKCQLPGERVSKLVGLLRSDNFTVGSISPKHVFPHHGHAHLAPGLVLVDQNTHGEGRGLHLPEDSPVWEDITSLALFHANVNTAAGTEKENSQKKKVLDDLGCTWK